MKRTRTARVLLVLSVLYWVVVFVSVLYNALLLSSPPKVVPPDHGCFLIESLLVGVECRGFFGAQLAGWLLSLPWIIFFITLLFPASDSLLTYLIFIPLATIFWGPLIYPFIHFFFTSRHRHAS